MQFIFMGMDEEGICKNKTRLWVNMINELRTFLQQVLQALLRKAAGNFGGLTA
jgi:hypothetical protein